MRFRNTAILGVVLALLAGYFYLFEANKEPDPVAETVFDIDRDSITRLKITSNEETTVVENVPQRKWQIIDPISFPADPVAVSNILNEFTALTPTRTVVDSAIDLSEYGLDPPSAVVEASAGLSTPRRLLLGDATATGAGVFAAAGNDRRVFLITNTVNSTFRKTTTELRDKVLFHIADKDKIDEFTVRFDRNTLTCARDSLGVWRVVEPFESPAEKNMAINMVDMIAGMKAEAFVEDAPTSLTQYGLHRPTATATLRSSDGSIDARLTIGQSENDMVYIQSNERPTVYRAYQAAVERIFKTGPDLRRATAFDMRSYEVSEVDWKLGPESATTVKRAFEDWRLVQPIETRADDRMITAFLDSMEVMRIQDFIPATDANLKEYGLDEAPISVTATLTVRPFSQTMLVGKTSDDGRTVYVKDAREDWVYGVNSSLMTNLPATTLELRDKRVLRFAGIDVNMLEIIDGEKRFRVRRDERQKVVWRMEEPARQDANAIAIGEAFSTLNDLYTEIFVTDEESGDLARFGLDSPEVRINLISGGRDGKPEERQSLLVGKSFPGDRSLVYVKRRDSPEVSLVKNDFLQRLRTMISNTSTS